MPSSTNIQTLRQLLKALQKKVQLTTLDLAQKELQLSQLSQALQSQKVLEEENGALMEQLTKLKKRIQATPPPSPPSTENGWKTRYEESEQLRATYEKQSLELTRQVHRLEEQLIEQKHLQDQKKALETSGEQLRATYNALIVQRNQLEHDLRQSRDHALQLEQIVHFTREELQKSHEALKKEHPPQTRIQELEDLLYDKELAMGNFEQDIARIKQALVRGVRELKEMEARFEETVQGKELATQRFQQSQYQIERLRDQVKLLEDQLEAALEVQRAAHKQWEEERVAAENHAQRNGVLQQELEVVQQQCREVQQELSAWKEESSRAKSLQADWEADLMQAKQHLAKKVKEVSALEDKNEELKVFISELQQVQNQSRVKIAELQTSVDFHTTQQKKLEEQLYDAVKGNEGQQQKWEEKYFALYEKWQAAEARIRELEKLEEKQRHLQGIWANLGTFLGPTGEPASKEMPPPIPPAQEPPIAVIHSPAKTAPNLFEKPSTPKIRQSFLE